MDYLNHARAMAAYNQWMNTRLYDLCEQLPDAERKRDLGAFFKSVHGTLNHILLADRVWMSRFTATHFSVTGLDQELYADFAELHAERAAEDERIIEWVGRLTPEGAAATLSYGSLVNPQPRRYPLWFALSHFFNHQTHHRGQVTTLLKQLGMEPGITDLIMLPDYQNQS